MIKFKTISVITSLIALILCVVLLLIPEFIFWLFSIEEYSSAFFIGRRAAMLFLGIAVITWMGRNAEHSESRQSICIGLSVSMFALALLGTIEYLRGYAGIGISLAVIIELVLAVLFFRVWFSYKNI